MKVLLMMLGLLMLTGCFHNPEDDIVVDNKGEPYIQGDMALIEIDGCGA